MKLQAKESSIRRATDYVSAHNVPAQAAYAESMVLFASFRNAVEAMLDVVDIMPGRPDIQSSALSNYLMLKSLYDSMSKEMKKIDLSLRVIGKKILELEVTDG